MCMHVGYRVLRQSRAALHTNHVPKLGNAEGPLAVAGLQRTNAVQNSELDNLRAQKAATVPTLCSGRVKAFTKVLANHQATTITALETTQARRTQRAADSTSSRVGGAALKQRRSSLDSPEYCERGPSQDPQLLTSGQRSGEKRPRWLRTALFVSSDWS